MAITVHIIDSSKPSLVMSSEVFKDKIPGAIVSFSLNAKDGLAYVGGKLGKDSPDALVVDFNLPDADGVSLIKELRKFYKGPIFTTAAPDRIVDYAVQEELFHYHDACCWIPKPVRYDVLEKRIEQFLINRHRLGKRFEVDLPSLMVGKGEGRGKRAPKFDGRLVNISMGGMGLVLTEPGKLKRDEEFIVTMGIPAGAIEGSTPLSVLKEIVAVKEPAKSASTKVAVKVVGKDAVSAKKMSPAQKAKEAAKSKAADGKLKGAQAAAKEQVFEVTPVPPTAVPVKLEEYKIKATVAWHSDGGRKVGLQFSKIPESQRRQIEVYLKGLSA